MRKLWPNTEDDCILHLECTRSSYEEVAGNKIEYNVLDLVTIDLCMHDVTREYSREGASEVSNVYVINTPIKLPRLVEECIKIEMLRYTLMKVNAFPAFRSFKYVPFKKCLAHIKKSIIPSSQNDNIIYIVGNNITKTILSKLYS